MFKRCPPYLDGTLRTRVDLVASTTTRSLLKQRDWPLEARRMFFCGASIRCGLEQVRVAKVRDRLLPINHGGGYLYPASAGQVNYTRYRSVAWFSVICYSALYNRYRLSSKHHHLSGTLLPWLLAVERPNMGSDFRMRHQPLCL